jgi:hypothetical protein
MVTAVFNIKKGTLIVKYNSMFEINSMPKELKGITDSWKIRKILKKYIGQDKFNLIIEQ